jgi:CBS domain containing-hemolysin-like protein
MKPFNVNRNKLLLSSSSSSSSSWFSNKKDNNILDSNTKGISGPSRPTALSLLQKLMLVLLPLIRRVKSSTSNITSTSTTRATTSKQIYTSFCWLVAFIASSVAGLPILLPILAVLLPVPAAHASVGVPSTSQKLSMSPVQGMVLWGSLFLLSAGLHSAESAITKISPWKVQEFVDEEGQDSPFAQLSSNLTKLLSTILLTTTACSIYSTALFVQVASDLFPKASLGFITAALTAVTLFFGELLPKALAVSNSELVARKMVPMISQLANVLMPMTATVTFLSDLVLRIAGLRSVEDRNVSEDMLRLIVDEAQRTEGIATGEGRMIKAVLDMQDNEVSKIMQPRVAIVALPEGASATEILKVAVSTKYSRIPIYRGDVDNIVGVVFTKDLLDFMNLPSDDTKSEFSKFRPQMKEDWTSTNATQLMKPTYFIPETMNTWNALQEMRRRRLHLAIVVDEYGGTAGLVTFEDILEEVVGEIYDEDDVEEEAVDSRTIFKNADGSFEMKGYAELDDVCEALGLELDDEELGEYSTIGGFLCSEAGEIPREGDQLVLCGYKFVVKEVEDNRRIISLSAEILEKDKTDAEISDDNKNDADRSEKGDNKNSAPVDNTKNDGIDNATSDKVQTFIDGEWV